jgi:excisionase family DNA binding protein
MDGDVHGGKQPMVEAKFGYTIEELANSGPIKRSKLYEAIKAGELIARKHGRKTLVLASDYMTFLENLPKMK